MSDVGFGALVNSYLQEKHQKQQDQRQKAIDLANQHAQQVQSQLEQRRVDIEEKAEKDRSVQQSLIEQNNALRAQADLLRATTGVTTEADREAENQRKDAERKAAIELKYRQFEQTNDKMIGQLFNHLTDKGQDPKQALDASEAAVKGDGSKLAALPADPLVKAQINSLTTAAAAHTATVAEVNARTAMTNLKALQEKIDLQYESQKKSLQNIGIELDNKAKAMKPDELRAEINLKNAEAQAALNSALIKTQLAELQKTHTMFQEQLASGKMQAEAQKNKAQLDKQVAAAVKAHSAAINKYNYLLGLSNHPPDANTDPAGFKQYIALKGTLPQMLEQSRQDINSYLQVEGAITVLASEAGVALANGTTVMNPDGSINVEATERNINAAEKARTDAKRKADNPPQIPPPPRKRIKVGPAAVTAVKKIGADKVPPPGPGDFVYQGGQTTVAK